MENQNGFYPLDLLSRALRCWPWIVGFSLIGAIIGLIYSLLRPPLYEAQAVLGVNINYGITEPLELGVEDRSLDRVASLIVSDSTIQRVFEAVPDELRQARGWSLQADSSTKLRLEQRLAEWWLIVTDPNPSLATEMAQAWAEVTIELLDEATEHAWRAAALLDGKFDVECTHEESDGSSVWQCQVLPLELEPEALAGSLQAELAASHGILPIVSYELLRSATPPERPVLWGRASLVLAGSLAGLVVGVAVIFLKRQSADRTSNEQPSALSTSVKV